MFIPDPNCFHPGSASKNSSNITQKLLVCSWKYDPGCSIWIRIPDPHFQPIPDLGVKKALDPGSGTLIIRINVIKFKNEMLSFRTGYDKPRVNSENKLQINSWV
jgi:hypothetical protein